MKKNKILIFTLSVTAVCSAAVGLAACGVPQLPPPPPHVHSYTAYGYDDQRHWRVCPDDNERDETSYGNHDFSNGDCVCGKKSPVAEHVHDWAKEWSTDVHYHWHECSGCDERENQAEHSTDNDEYVFEAADETGHWHVCKVCGEDYAKKEHSAGFKERDEKGHWTACHHCDYKIGYEDHVFGDNDKCSCGYDLAGTEGLVFELNAGGYAYVLKSAADAVAEDIVIPSTYNGLYVAEIASGAFDGCATVKSIRISPTVSKIGSNAFSGCKAITSIELPSGIKSVATSAFNGCEALECITVKGGESELFAAVDGILYSINSSGSMSVISIPVAVKGVVNIPDKVTTIENDAFKNRAKLQKVVFGEESKATSFGLNAFSGCAELTEIVLPKNLKTIRDYCFQNCRKLTAIELPSGVTKIEQSTFSGCSELSTVNLPSALKEIGSSAFMSCKKLTQIHIPASVTSLGKYAFFGCLELVEVKFEEGCQISAISDSTFMSDRLLKTINIPSGVKTIGNMAFQNCMALSGITLPEGLQKIGDSAFYNCNNLKRIEIPDSVTGLGVSAFTACTQLSEVVFGEGSQLKTTGTGSFSRCASLTSITLPDSLETIGSSLFADCSNLAEINISANSNIKTIGNLAFSGCAALEYIVIPRLTVPETGNSIGNTIFTGCEKLTKIYYTGTKAEWEALKIDPRDEELATDARLVFYYENQADVPADGGSYWHFVDGKPAQW